MMNEPTNKREEAIVRGIGDPALRAKKLKDYRMAVTKSVSRMALEVLGNCRIPGGKA